MFAVKHTLSHAVARTNPGVRQPVGFVGSTTQHEVPAACLCTHTTPRAHLHAPDIQADGRQNLVGVRARQVSIRRLQPLKQRCLACLVDACGHAMAAAIWRLDACDGCIAGRNSVICRRAHGTAAPHPE